MTEQQQADHQRIRRELWTGAYLEAQKQSAARVQPEFRFVEAADYALAAFDRRFGEKERTPDFSGLRSCPGSVAPGVPAVNPLDTAAQEVAVEMGARGLRGLPHGVAASLGGKP